MGKLVQTGFSVRTASDMTAVRTRFSERGSGPVVVQPRSNHIQKNLQKELVRLAPTRLITLPLHVY